MNFHLFLFFEFHHFKLQPFLMPGPWQVLGDWDRGTCDWAAMPAEKAQEGMRPAWWKEKDGGAPLVPEIMPKKDSKTRHSFSGKEMEKMIWNRYHNTKWVGKAADLFVGGGNGAAQTRMQA